MGYVGAGVAAREARAERRGSRRDAFGQSGREWPTPSATPATLAGLGGPFLARRPWSRRRVMATWAEWPRLPAPAGHPVARGRPSGQEQCRWLPLMHWRPASRWRRKAGVTFGRLSVTVSGAPWPTGMGSSADGWGRCHRTRGHGEEEVARRRWAVRRGLRGRRAPGRTVAQRS